MKERGRRERIKKKEKERKRENNNSLFRFHRLTFSQAGTHAETLRVLLGAEQHQHNGRNRAELKMVSKELNSPLKNSNCQSTYCVNLPTLAACSTLVTLRHHS